MKTRLSYYKELLKENGSNTRYFNRAFLDTFTTAYNARKKNIENGVFNASGTAGYEYNPVTNTRFYMDNGTAYCKFLEIYNG